MQLKVEYAYDEEAGAWGFAVPALHIVGSADTREEARGNAIAAIEFALEGAPANNPAVPGTVTELFEVTVRPSTAA